MYCLITGGSEGLGRAFAIECASRKMNLILVALPGPELYRLAALIRDVYKVKVIPMEKDLGNEANCIELFEEIKSMGLQVNVLINNAGIGNTHLFTEGSVDFYQRLLSLNVMATTLMTRLFLDALGKNGPAYILNVGSLCSFFFLARKQVYGATKSFIYFFSKSLRRELERENISVSVVCPGAMCTNHSVTAVIKSSSWLSRKAVMDPKIVAEIAINGMLKGKEVIIPGILNKVLVLLNNFVPAKLTKLFTNYQVKSLNSIKPGDIIHSAKVA